MKLIFKITIFLIFIFFLQNILFISFPNISHYPASKIDVALENKADVIIFGDSTMVASDYRDVDTRPIYMMLQDKLPTLNVKAIDDLAYAAEVYLEQARYIVRNKYKPKLVIIPINIRSFSPQWDQRPDFQFEMEKLVLRYKNTPVFPYLKFLINLNLYNLVPISKSQFHNTPVYSNGKLIGTMKDFEGPEYKIYTESHQNNIILISYTYTLSNNHRKLKAFEEVADLLSTNNIKTIFYFTPVDYETIEKYAGSLGINQISQNSNIIKNSRREKPATLLDLTFKLPTSEFSWRDSMYVNEHLNQNGRQFLASELAASVIDALKNNK